MAIYRITYQGVQGRVEVYSLSSTYAFPTFVRRVLKEGFLLQGVYNHTTIVAPGAVLQIQEDESDRET